MSQRTEKDYWGTESEHSVGVREALHLHWCVVECFVLTYLGQEVLISNTAESRIQIWERTYTTDIAVWLESMECCT